jgi:hypothetical protein
MPNRPDIVRDPISLRNEFVELHPHGVHDPEVFI